MVFLDWLVLALAAATGVGMQMTPGDNNELLQRSSALQTNAARPLAQVTVGGNVALRLADSGLETADERAREVEHNLSSAIVRFDLAAHNIAYGWHAEGNADFCDLYYFDARLATATAADTRANGAPSATALAGAWLQSLKSSFMAIPQPLPDGWIAASGRASGRVIVSDATLALALSVIIPDDLAGTAHARLESGSIVLEGRVPSEAKHQELLRLFHDLPGTREIIDRLMVP